LDEQPEANGYLIEIDDPELGWLRQVAAPWWSTVPVVKPRPAPLLGQHNDEPLSVRERGPAQPASGAPDRPILAGLKVVDFGSFVGGPFASTLLARLGADVVKVEPRTGDRMRLDDLIFVGTQAGKRSVAVDLKAAAASGLKQRLLEWADVVHLNIRERALTALGLDYETVRGVNPRAIYCHVSAFGPVGPKQSLPVFDPELQAYAGWMLAGRGANGRPLMCRCAPLDLQGAMLSLIPTLIALIERERTGEGAHIEASLLGAATLTTSEMALDLASDRLLMLADGPSELNGLQHGYAVYATQSGHVAIAAVTEARRTALQDTFGPDVAASLSELSPVDALRILGEAGVPAEEVRIAQELPFLRDPVNERLGLVMIHDHPIYGRLGQIGAFWDTGSTPSALDRPCPTLGQHTREVLLELGMSDAEIRNLAASGVISGDALM
jgi:crotonobetainyl-CoA:carnitine CoA-transferase CaiB-like acyl-CoA transferase